MRASVRFLFFMRFFVRVVGCAVFCALLAHACARPLPGEITRERAVDIARSQVTFPASSLEAVKVSVRGRPIWRVTIRGRLPGQPTELFETRIVEIDRVSGVIVSVSRS
jgi:hypothetical protein